MSKPLFGILAAVVVVIAAAKFAYNVTTNPGDEPVREAWTQNKIEFVTWNNEKWTAWIHDGQFNQIPENTNNWSRHQNASIAFTGWDGESWQAKIDGDNFLLAHQGNWQDNVERSDALRYRDWSGNNQLRTVAELQR